MNNRGSIQDIIPILFICFGMLLSMVIVFMVISSVNTDFQGDANVPQEAKNIIGYVNDDFPGVMEFWFLLFFIGLPLSSAILAYFNNIHPLYFYLSIPFIIIVIVYGASLSELWGDLKEDETFASYAANFPIPDYILSNYGLYSLFVSIIVLAGTFVRMRGRGDLIGGFNG